MTATLFSHSQGLSLLGGRAREDDAINRVYVMDTDKFAFNQAEVYHQFHNGIGKTFPSSYTRDLKVSGGGGSSVGVGGDVGVGVTSGSQGQIVQI